MTDSEPESEIYYLLLKHVPGDPDAPNDFEKLTTEIKNLQTEIKNLQTALYYTASIIRELDTSRFSDLREADE